MQIQMHWTDTCRYKLDTDRYVEIHTILYLVDILCQMSVWCMHVHVWCMYEKFFFVDTSYVMHTHKSIHMRMCMHVIACICLYVCACQCVLCIYFIFCYISCIFCRQKCQLGDMHKIHTSYTNTVTDIKNTTDIHTHTSKNTCTYMQSKQGSKCAYMV